MKKECIRNTISRVRLTMMLLAMGIIPFFVSCEKEMEGQDYRVYDDQMIDEIMQEKQLTSFLSIVDKANYRSTIHAYGAYTLFVPTNEAVDTYLKDQGKSSIDELSQEEAIDIVKYHLVRDTIAASAFIDGRVRTANFMKRYLTTKSDGGLVKVNRQANIVTKEVIGKSEDLKGANGYVHIINGVLTPPDYSITDAVRALPDADYSLMKLFFEKSGLADELDKDPDDNWITFFIQDNQAFRDAGIDTEAKLLAVLHENQKSNTMTDAELIQNYIGYHAATDATMPKYGTDLLMASTMMTKGFSMNDAGEIVNKPILFERVGTQVWLNRLVTDEINDPGVQLDRESYYTDFSCSNGVIHKILGDIQMKERAPYRVYWDIATQPEIMAMSTYRQPGNSKTFNSGELSEMTWGGTYLATVTYTSGTVPATASALVSDVQYVYGDYLRFNIHPNTIKWVEFKLPVLMPGEYKVWVAYRREVNLQVKTIFMQEGKEDQVMPYIFNMNEYMPNKTPEQMELEGWKQYNAKKLSTVVCCHILGTIKVEYEGRHTLRFEPIYSHAQGQAGSWDMIQFIPKEEDQTWPRVDMLGNWVYDGTATDCIYPYPNGIKPEDCK